MHLQNEMDRSCCTTEAGPSTDFGPVYMKAAHGEMNRFLMTKTTWEMRVVPSYGPNIPSKVL